MGLRDYKKPLEQDRLDVQKAASLSIHGCDESGKDIPQQAPRHIPYCEDPQSSLP
jgi:hypothetical protein